jgi:hypothetical protein
MVAWRTRIACRIHSEYVALTAFPPPTMVAWTRLKITLYVHCLSVLLFFLFYLPHCHTSCGIPSRYLPSHPDCNAVVCFLRFSCFTLHASQRARRWIVRAYERNKTAAISLHHCALCVRNMSMTKSIKVYVSCNRELFFLHNGVKMC